MGIRCFLLEESGTLRRYLCRYHTLDCPAPWRFLNGMTPLDTVEHPPNTTISLADKADIVPPGDPRWPVQCDCGHVFTESNPRQLFVEGVYRRVDTGEEMIIRDAPPGAMWNAWWFSPHWCGADGKSIMVRCPDGHDWCIDSRASNCTMKDDNVHKCWVRHGEPPNLTVDKNGVTCAAGAGSIQTPKWHGFLRNGELVT